MVKIASVPGTACHELPPGVADFFGGVGDTWQVHLKKQEGSLGWTTHTLQESVIHILENFDGIPEGTKIDIQGHSYGAKLLMNAFVARPDSWSKIRCVRLIHPPHNHDGFARQFEENTGFARAIKKKNPDITFTPQYIASLRDDVGFRTFYDVYFSLQNRPRLDVFGSMIDQVVGNVCPKVKGSDGMILPYWDPKLYGHIALKRDHNVGDLPGVRIWTTSFDHNFSNTKYPGK